MPTRLFPIIPLPFISSKYSTFNSRNSQGTNLCDTYQTHLAPVHCGTKIRKCEAEHHTLQYVNQGIKSLLEAAITHLNHKAAMTRPNKLLFKKKEDNYLPTKSPGQSEIIDSVKALAHHAYIAKIYKQYLTLKRQFNING